MPDEALAKAIAHLRAINNLFGVVVTEAGKMEGQGPVEQIAARLGTFGFRQVGAIAVLAETSDALHLQVGQLVRSLLEAWFYAAWMVAPDDDAAKRRRAIGLVRSGVRGHREKLEYQMALFITDPNHLPTLIAYETEVKEHAETYGVDNPPDLRQGMEALGRPDRYMLYRWESDAVHASTTGLGQLVDQSGEVTLIGVAGKRGQAMARIVAAWDTAGDLFEIVAHELGLELPDWEAKRQEAYDELLALYTES